MKFIKFIIFIKNFKLKNLLNLCSQVLVPGCQFLVPFPQNFSQSQFIVLGFKFLQFLFLVPKIPFLDSYRISGSRFYMSDFRFQNPDFNFFWFQITAFRFLVPDSRCQISGSRFQMSDFWFPILDVRFQVLDSRCQMSDFGFQIIEFRCEISGSRLQNSDVWFQIIEFRCQIFDSKLQNSDVRCVVPDYRIQM